MGCLQSRQSAPMEIINVIKVGQVTDKEPWKSEVHNGSFFDKYVRHARSLGSYEGVYITHGNCVLKTRPNLLRDIDSPQSVRSLWNEYVMYEALQLDEDIKESIPRLIDKGFYEVQNDKLEWEFYFGIVLSKCGQSLADIHDAYQNCGPGSFCSIHAPLATRIQKSAGDIFELMELKGYFHNDKVERNCLYNAMEDKVYVCDFESVVYDPTKQHTAEGYEDATEHTAEGCEKVKEGAQQTGERMQE